MSALCRHCQLLSVGVDNVIKVWDLRANKCCQTISPDDWPRAEDARPNAMTYDVPRNRVVTAHKRPAAWENKLVLQESIGHRAPVVKALYNASFSVAVSADESAPPVCSDSACIRHAMATCIAARVYRAYELPRCASC